MPATPRLRLTTTLAVAVLAASLAGCSSVEELFPVPTLTDTSASTAAPTPSAVATPTPYVPTGDLATGTVTHTLPAGAAQVQIVYYTAQDPNTWTAATEVPINVSATIVGIPVPEDPTNAQDIKVTRFLLQREGEGGYDLANDNGEFVITPPYSYASTVVLAAQPGQTGATLRVTMDLIFETAPDSNQYTRQTIVDTLNLGFAP